MKAISSIFILVMVAIVSGGGVYLWQNDFLNKKDTNKAISNDAQSNIAEELTRPTEEMYRDGEKYAWKKYQDEDLGVRFRYPADFVWEKPKNPDAPSSVIGFTSMYRSSFVYGWAFSPDNFYFESGKPSDYDDIIKKQEKLFSDGGSSLKIDKKIIKSGNQQWEKYTIPRYGTDGGFVYYRMDKAGASYIFNISSGNTGADVLMKTIISTFEMEK